MAHMSGTVPDYAAEYRMRKRNGAWLWVVCRGKVIERDGDGMPLRMIGYIQDISESKQAESALRESEERFRQLAENIHQVFWITTLPLDKLVYVSPAYEEIWGRNRDSLYRNPRSWMDSVHAEDLPRVRAAAESMARGRPLDAEYRIVRPDGTLRWIRDRSYPMRAGDGAQLACGIAEDITDLKLAEQEKLTHAIHQRDALVREVHHRIKNSLQGVVGLLRQKVRKYPAVAPDIEEAIGQLQSLALVYGLQETRPDGLLSLADITDAICSSAEKLIGGRVERKVERESPEHACIAGAEAVSVAVALNELVFNALKHQPAQAGRKRATVRLRESRGTAEICISNRGNLPKSFDFAGGRSVGYGLGLVRTLLAPPGGKIVFNGGRDKVEVKLTLAPPLLAGRRKAYAK
jgi:PAS domain S-box-containing protein